VLVVGPVEGRSNKVRNAQDSVPDGTRKIELRGIVRRVAHRRTGHPGEPRSTSSSSRARRSMTASIGVASFDEQVCGLDRSSTAPVAWPIGYASGSFELVLHDVPTHRGELPPPMNDA
jgi:hypothetical protein